MTPAPVPRPRRIAPQVPTRRELRTHPAVGSYTLFCLAALFLLVVCLADRGLGWWGLMPALIGAVALLAHWSMGPPMVVVALTGLLMSSARYRAGHPYWARNQAPTLMDLVLCVGVLAYAVGHYRLLSLTRHVFPAEPPRPDVGRRSADLVSAHEMALLVLTLPLWTSAAVLVWGWAMKDAPALGMPTELWRTLRIVWVGLAIVVVTAIVAGYVRQALTTPEEGLLYLQDQLWRQTRREQSSLNRWLAWARLRAAQKGDVMRFWWRELSGWLMVGLGLLCFVVVWQFCKRRWLLEAVPMTFIGMLIFWGGIHLLKVAIAARVCQQVQDRLYPAPEKKGERSA